jgi:hypothetical protein
MSETEKLNKRSRNFQLLMLAIILVGFPIATYLVQQNGLKQSKLFFKDLKNNLGEFPDAVAATNYYGDFKPELLRGQTRVVAFATANSRDSLLPVFLAFARTEQFQEEIDNLSFLTFDMVGDSSYYRNYAQSLTKRERQRWWILRGGNDLAQAIKLPNEYACALIDTAGIIRRFYDIREASERKILTEHISVMPIRKKEKVEKRDQKQM